jgi:hypothetical protein
MLSWNYAARYFDEMPELEEEKPESVSINT